MPPLQSQGVVLEARWAMRTLGVTFHGYPRMGVDVSLDQGPGPNRSIEYLVAAVEEGTYRISIRYVTSDDKQLNIVVNDQAPVEMSLGKTGGVTFSDLVWSDKYSVELQRGWNVLSFQTSGSIATIVSVAIDTRGHPIFEKIRIVFRCSDRAT